MDENEVNENENENENEEDGGGSTSIKAMWKCWGYEPYLVKNTVIIPKDIRLFSLNHRGDRLYEPVSYSENDWVYIPTHEETIWVGGKSQTVIVMRHLETVIVETKEGYSDLEVIKESEELEDIDTYLSSEVELEFEGYNGETYSTTPGMTIPAYFEETNNPYYPIISNNPDLQYISVICPIPSQHQPNSTEYPLPSYMPEIHLNIKLRMLVDIECEVDKVRTCGLWFSSPSNIPGAIYAQKPTHFDEGGEPCVIGYRSRNTADETHPIGFYTNYDWGADKIAGTIFGVDLGPVLPEYEPKYIGTSFYEHIPVENCPPFLVKAANESGTSIRRDFANPDPFFENEDSEEEQGSKNEDSENNQEPYRGHVTAIRWYRYYAFFTSASPVFEEVSFTYHGYSGANNYNFKTDNILYAKTPSINSEYTAGYVVHKNGMPYSWAHAYEIDQYLRIRGLSTGDLIQKLQEKYGGTFTIEKQGSSQFAGRWPTGQLDLFYGNGVVIPEMFDATATDEETFYTNEPEDWQVYPTISARLRRIGDSSVSITVEDRVIEGEKHRYIYDINGNLTFC